MNRDEGFYQPPHIYDYLLSVTATPGRQSFRRRQQRLPKRQQQLIINLLLLYLPTYHLLTYLLIYLLA